MSGVLDALLGESFDAAMHPRDWHGKFRADDMVRLKRKAADGMPIVGRIQRFSEDGSKVIIAPVRGDRDAHVEAGPGDIAFHTPQSHAQTIARQAKLDAERIHSSGVSIPSGVNDPNFARARKAREAQALSSSSRERGIAQLDAERAAGRRMARPRVRESAGVAMLVEAFKPAETPAQSAAIGAQQVAQAKSDLAAWAASKHPRGRGGKFAYTTGGKRARKGSASHRTLTVGAHGALVRSIQRQLGISADGKYGPQTRAAVTRFQQQHGLHVDGIVGRQTLAALRGHVNAKSIAPGPIGSRQARLKAPRMPARAVKPAAPTRIAGGQLI